MVARPCNSQGLSMQTRQILFGLRSESIAKALGFEWQYDKKGKRKIRRGFMSITTNQFDRLEDRVNSLDKETGQIQGALPSLATKGDVSQAQLNTTRWLIGVGVVILVAILGTWGHLFSQLVLIASRLPG